MVVEYTADIFFDLLNLSRRGIGGGETVVSVDPILLPHLVRSSVSRKHPTSSQVSAPSKLPIMTSKGLSFFFCHCSCLCVSSEFFAWMIMFLSSSAIWSKFAAKPSALFKSFSLIEG